MEDNPADARMTVEALRAGKLSNGLHADSFFNKPIDVGQLTRLVADIDGLWLSIVELPG